jgi:hypothetical protein
VKIFRKIVQDIFLNNAPDFCKGRLVGMQSVQRVPDLVRALYQDEGIDPGDLRSGLVTGAVVRRAHKYPARLGFLEHAVQTDHDRITISRSHGERPRPTAS